MMAYSMAGVAATQCSPDIQLEKTLGADSSRSRWMWQCSTTTALSGRQGLCRLLGACSGCRPRMLTNGLSG